MAHKKAGGSSRNGRDSDGRRLGVKLYEWSGGNPWQHHRVSAAISFWPGQGVGQGKDHTIFATAEQCEISQGPQGTHIYFSSSGDAGR